MITLTSEQIKNWRHIIMMRLEDIHPGSGAYALIMPESEVLDYAEKMKKLLEEPFIEPENTNHQLFHFDE